MTALPVMIFHQGNPRYLKKVMRQANAWNDQVWLLGDHTNQECAVNWVDSTAIQSRMFEQFLEVYEHMSTRSRQAEMFCFESHFKYYEFARRMGWNRFVTMDSDVLVYHRFDKMEFGNVDAAFGWTDGRIDERAWACDPFVTYWTIEAMEEFLLFCIQIYKEDPSLLKQKWAYHREKQVSGGICDMTLFWLWRNRTTRKIYNLAQEKDGKVYDLIVNSPDNAREGEYCFSKWKNMKVVRFREGVPYLKRSDGQWVQANVLHCNGHHKQYIGLLQRCSNMALEYVAVNWLVKGKIAVKRGLKKFWGK